MGNKWVRNQDFSGDKENVKDGLPRVVLITNLDMQKIGVGFIIDKANVSTPDISILVEQLVQCLKKLRKSNTLVFDSSLFTQVSNNLQAFLSLLSNNGTWVINLGATNHTTNNLNFLLGFTSKSNTSIFLSNDASIFMLGNGKINFFSNYSSLEVLYIPFLT